MRGIEAPNHFVIEAEQQQMAEVGIRLDAFDDQDAVIVGQLGVDGDRLRDRAETCDAR